VRPPYGCLNYKSFMRKSRYKNIYVVSMFGQLTKRTPTTNPYFPMISYAFDNWFHAYAYKIKLEEANKNKFLSGHCIE
jgi:hypothetical protein